MSKQIMKAGYYYIGDPCYVVPDEDWGEFVTATFEHEFEDGSNPFQFKGNNCWVHGTYFGDGVYQDELGIEYPVDSGCIGLVEISMFMDKIPAEDITTGVIEEFLEDFQVEYRNGRFYIGDIKINTKKEDSF